jgi:uncharacterized protein YndB with AHSA1/START domain
MWTWVLIDLAVLAGGVVLVGVIGSRLPRSHVVSRERVLAQSPEAVWQAINDFEQLPSWNPMVKSVERLPDRDGRPVWRESYSNSYKMTLAVTEADPPRRLVRTIADEGLPFTGGWEFVLVPAEGGSRLTITERGEVPNPFIRFMFCLFMNPATNLEKHLGALAPKTGQSTGISR